VSKVWGAIILLLSGASPAWSTKSHVQGSTNEAAKALIPWSKIITNLDAERSKTIHHYQKLYAKDRGEPEPPFRALQSLQAKRRLDLSGVDRCVAKRGETELSFGDVLGRNVELASMARRVSTNQPIDEGYSLGAERIGVSLRSHPYCIEATPKHSINAALQPDQELQTEMNDYLRKGNELIYRVNHAQNPVSYASAMAELNNFQGVMMACLSYVESLSGGDGSANEDALFADMNRRGHISRSRRPPGVAMKMDRPAGFYIGNRNRDAQIAVGFPQQLVSYVDDKGRQRTRYFRHSDELNLALKNVAEELNDSLEKVNETVKDRRAAEAQREELRAAAAARSAELRRPFVAKQLRAYHAAVARGASWKALHEEFFAEITPVAWAASGVYQFKFGNLDTDEGDVRDSNIGPCVDQWNGLYGSVCPVAHTIGGYAEALSSPGQAFNIFCGVQKIVQSFNVQVHTTNPAKTSPLNLGPDGKLKAPADRCVHPFWEGSRGYNHFGPLSNSVPMGSIASLPSYPGNLKMVLECLNKN
jgi:DNA-binding transcriptional MerR regulator